jgi:hypothetical protein
MIRVGAVLAAAWLATISASSSRADTTYEPVDGAGASVVVRSTPDAVLLCVRAARGRKLNGEFGIVTTWPQKDDRLWGRDSPYVVDTGMETMPSPTLVRLDRKSLGYSEPLSVDVGVCVEGGCDIATFKVMAPVVDRRSKSEPFCVR